MSSEYLRTFINERLTAAAEEIFGVFTTTIVKYEEEIDRQRKLLDHVLKPQLQLRWAELPQQHVCNEEEVSPEQQQERNPSLDQEDSEPARIKEELCTSQESEQLVLKQELDMCYPTYGESDYSELNSESAFNMPVISSVVSEAHSHDQLLSHNSDEAESQDQNGGRHEDSRDAEPKSQEIHHESNGHINDHRNTCRGERSFKCDVCMKVFKCTSELLTHLSVHTGEKPLDREDQEPPQNKEELCTSQEGEQHVLKQETDTSKLTSTYEEGDYSEDETEDFYPDDPLSAEEEPLINMPVISSVVSEAHSHHQLSHEAKSQDQKGDKRHHKNNGHNLKRKSKSQRHLRIHTGKKSYSCNTCGKRFCDTSILNAHIRVHSAEKPHSCKTCGRHFRLNSRLLVHVRRAHPDEKPYSCEVCGTGFKWRSCLTLHMRTHSGEKPYSCNTCGRDFRRSSGLLVHVRRAHTGERP